MGISGHGGDLAARDQSPQGGDGEQADGSTPDDQDPVLPPYPGGQRAVESAAKGLYEDRGLGSERIRHPVELALVGHHLGAPAPGHAAAKPRLETNGDIPLRNPEAVGISTLRTRGTGL